MICNEVFLADNMSHMAWLASSTTRFTLAYLDPPFFTQRTHRMPDGEVAFEDRWPSFHAYVETVARAAQRAWSLLTPEGCVVVHVDSRTSHHLKVALDGCIGRGCFASEIVWRYRRWPSKTTNFQRVHDVLLRYVRDPKATPRWNQLYEPLAESTRKQWGTGKQKAVTGYGGARLKSSVTDEPSPGVALGDVWDIGILAPVSRERTGFPTQKPEALLERLVLATTNPGDWVLDPYCGSGTTNAVCARLGRHVIGIDCSKAAVRVARERLGHGGPGNLILRNVGGA